MGNIIGLVKKVSFVKKLRENKWRKHALRWMFTPDQVATLNVHPEEIKEAVKQQIKNHSQDLSGLEGEINRAFYLSGVLDHYEGSVEDLKTDILFWQFAYGYSVNEYLCYQFMGKSKEERLKFLSDRESVLLGYRLNDIDAMSVFVDKMATYKKFRKYFGREAVAIEHQDDFNVFVDYKEKHSRFVKKNVFQSCGRSVELIDTTKSGKSDFEQFKEIISEGKVILEEVITQGSATGIFNESSVNTIRCITLNTTDHGICAPFCFMKVGRQGAFIDNGAAGGIFVGIDAETGILSSDGVEEHGVRFEVHPDSGIRFKGYQLPEWDKMINMCIEMSSMTPKVKWVGWDMAFTDRGWIAVEGNALTEVIGPQSTRLMGIRAEMERLLWDARTL